MRPYVLFITLILGIMLGFNATITATEKPADTKTETAKPAEPSVSAIPTQKVKTDSSAESTEQIKKVDDTAPLAFVPQKKFAFPSTMDGTRVLHDFIIQNKGDADLKITKVRTG